MACKDDHPRSMRQMQHDHGRRGREPEPLPDFEDDVTEEWWDDRPLHLWGTRLDPTFWGHGNG